jgi:hypothetical protein
MKRVLKQTLGLPVVVFVLNAAINLLEPTGSHAVFVGMILGGQREIIVSPS